MLLFQIKRANFRFCAQVRYRFSEWRKQLKVSDTTNTIDGNILIRSSSLDHFRSKVKIVLLLKCYLLRLHCKWFWHCSLETLKCIIPTWMKPSVRSFFQIWCRSNISILSNIEIKFHLFVRSITCSRATGSVM